MNGTKEKPTEQKDATKTKSKEKWANKTKNTSKEMSKMC